VKLLTRSGLGWTAKYPAMAAAFAKLKVNTAYIDGELCGVRPDGVTSFAIMQQVSDSGGGHLTYLAFDLLELNGEDVARLPLAERKARLAALLKKPSIGIAYSDHEGSDGEAIRRAACKHGLEGIVSKRLDRPYLPGDRGAWVKSKCLNRAEFVIVGWSDPKGARPLLGALLLGYYEPGGRLIYAGRVGTGMPVSTLAMLYERLRPLATKTMPLAKAPPPKQRFGAPLALSKVHWARPELVAEITYMSWADDGLLRHTVFLGPREDKPAREVRREVPRALPSGTEGHAQQAQNATGELNVVVTRRVQAGKEGEVEAILRNLQAATLANDKGCLRYEWYRASTPQTHMLLENWADQAAAQEHLKAPHVMTAREKLMRLDVEKPQAVRLTKL
jgi:DNA ligase D-like protein (predicted ligase)